MRLRMTHTYVEVEISPTAYAEVEKKLREADYNHVFVGIPGEHTMDMTGLALTRGAEVEPVGYIYELAGAMLNGEHCNWKTNISFTKPNAGKGMRNVRPLYAGDPIDTA